MSKVDDYLNELAKDEMNIKDKLVLAYMHGKGEPEKHQVCECGLTLSLHSGNENWDSKKEEYICKLSKGKKFKPQNQIREMEK